MLLFIGCVKHLWNQKMRGSWQHQDGKKHKEMGVKLLRVLLEKKGVSDTEISDSDLKQSIISSLISYD